MRVGEMLDLSALGLTAHIRERGAKGYTAG